MVLDFDVEYFVTLPGAYVPPDTQIAEEVRTRLEMTRDAIATAT